MRKNSGKLSVAFCYDDSLDKYDGVAQYVKILGQWLNSNGHKVVYFVGETKMREWVGDPVFSMSKNKEVVFNRNYVTIPLPASKEYINRVLAKHNIDILHVQMPYSPFMTGRIINRIKPQTAVVGTFHIYPAGFLASFGTRLLRQLCRRSLRRFSTVLAVSPAAADFAKKTFGIDAAVSSNVVELARFKTVDVKPQKNHIVFLGRLVKRKGCRELLMAFRLLRLRVPGVRLTIAGDGPQRRRLEKLVKRYKLGESVKFTGFVSEKDKPDLLATADIACFPSLGGESFGVVLVEAMAAGAGVVVGGNNPGYATVLSGRPKTLVDQRNISNLARQLELFLTDRKLTQDVHAWQQKLVQRYDVDLVGKQVVEVYRHARLLKLQER
ncbi:glycosyltransferase family 4 protein [Candidatus Saccharibacteria bacterium]|nr:glycosyltransferase family 4 protein [Candidatus Saccharibacteria bacterium]